MEYTYLMMKEDIKNIAQAIQNTFHPDEIQGIYGVPRGGIIPAMEIASILGVPYLAYFDENVSTRGIIIVDDIVDSGSTRMKYKLFPFYSLTAKYYSNPKVGFVTARYVNNDEWVHFWWEPQGEIDVRDSVIRQLEYIGENPTREGLLKTPERVVRSWGKLFRGYTQDPKTVFTTFDTDGYDGIVLLKNIEMYSMCEHHLLPFSGKAHIAYIPDKRVIGISKLARLMEIYSRRAQIQERICRQITGDLMKYLEPKAAACIIEAEHFCIRMRGVNKQNSIMVTSSLEGAFLNNQSARDELMQLIGK